MLGVADLVFLAFFAASAWRFGLRRRATAAALLVALPAALAIELAADRRGARAARCWPRRLLLPNLDLLPGLLAGAARE